MDYVIKMKKIKRKVVCVYGKYDHKSDFVLEPATKSDKDYFYIENTKK